MDKDVRTINEGIYDSYVSEPDKTSPFSQSMLTNQPATNRSPTNWGRTNGRCTRNNTHFTHWCNIFTKEDFYREHSSSRSTICFKKRAFSRTSKFFTVMREGDGVVVNNDPYQGHPPSTSGRSTPTNGPHRAVTHARDIVMIQDTNAD